MASHKVFLGGTCADSTWRELLIPMLQVAYFNPVVETWTAACQSIENEQKVKHCDIHFYCITYQMEGVYSIAEIIDSAHTSDKHTVMQIMSKGFDSKMWQSLEAVGNLLQTLGGKLIVSDDLMDAANYLNKFEEY
jgi:hypothetical protein